MRRPQYKRPVDQRRYRTRLERELAVGGIAIVVIVGGGLIALIWGIPQLIGALLVIAIVVGVALLLTLILKLIEMLGREPE